MIIVQSLSDEDARKRFPEGWTTLKPYLRVVPQPGANKQKARRAALTDAD